MGEQGNQFSLCKLGFRFTLWLCSSSNHMATPFQNCPGSQGRTRRKEIPLDSETSSLGKIQRIPREGFCSNGRQPEENQDRATSSKERALCQVPLQSTRVSLFCWLVFVGCLAVWWGFSVLCLLWIGFFVLWNKVY